MKKTLSLIFSLLLITTAFGQKVKIKNDVAIIDGTPFVKFTTITLGSDYSIQNVKSSEDEISILYLDYIDPAKTSSGNPDGKVRWIEVNFVTLGLKCEVDSRGRKGFAKLLFRSKIYVNDQLNVENVNKFVSKYGTKYSDNRPAGNTTIIINN